MMKQSLSPCGFGGLAILIERRGSQFCSISKRLPADGPLLSGKWIGSLAAYFNRTTTSCTSPFDLLEDDADNFSTFATLVASLELTGAELAPIQTSAVMQCLAALNQTCL